MHRIRGKAALVAGVAVLAGAGTAFGAFQELPLGGQVNDDVAAGISPADPVNLVDPDPTNADVVAGSLVAGNPRVPWAIFQQREKAAAKPDQIFVRAFKGGAWSTQGNGTAGGLSSAAPTFTGSLNFDQAVDGEVPSIDFAGPGRAVPWATWYEDSTPGFSAKKQIFTSRFHPSTDANNPNKWEFAGQNRAGGGTPVPSLNIHTDQDAINPAIAGGSAADPTKPGPWITWQETGANAPGLAKQQIFVAKPSGANPANCNGFKLGNANLANAPVGGFCFGQVGIERLGADPTLNVDRTRDGVEPDIAFTGPSDAVPWVVWYEQNPTQTTGVNKLHDNEMVFAAKAVAPGTPPPTGTVDGGFDWTAVGNNGQGVLDNTAGNGGVCAANAQSEAACSLNANPDAEAEDVRVASGTMTAGNPTVPWVVWDEGPLNGNPDDNDVFVSRLVGAGAAARFVIANGGLPVAKGTRADITFSGNTPYISWHRGGKALYGHLVTPDSFVKDNGPAGTTVSADVRAPISSTCTADPFTTDGAACQGATQGTPFFLFTDGDVDHAKLLAQAYQTDAPVTGGADAVTQTTAQVSATVNTQGSPAGVQFEFGTTTSYGSATGVQHLSPGDDTPQAFSATLGGLPAGTTIHYRAVAFTDFGRVPGADRTLVTAAAGGTGGGGSGSGGGSGGGGGKRRAAPVHVKLKVAKTTLGHVLAAKSLRVTVRADRASTVKVTATTKVRVGKRSRTVTLGSGKVRFTKAGSKTLTIKLGSHARSVLRHLSKVKIALAASATSPAGGHGSEHLSVTIKR
jgi:hypothetical protein